MYYVVWFVSGERDFGGLFEILRYDIRIHVGAHSAFPFTTEPCLAGTVEVGLKSETNASDSNIQCHSIIHSFYSNSPILFVFLGTLTYHERKNRVFTS
jgi:hypothetical protein